MLQIYMKNKKQKLLQLEKLKQNIWLPQNILWIIKDNATYDRRSNKIGGQRSIFNSAQCDKTSTNSSK